MKYGRGGLITLFSPSDVTAFHRLGPMPEKDIARLQRVQNCLARVVTKAHVLVVPSYSKTIMLANSCQVLPLF